MLTGVSSSALPFAARMVITLVLVRSPFLRFDLFFEETPLTLGADSPRLAAATVRVTRAVLIHARRVHVATRAAQKAEVFPCAHTDANASSMRIARLFALFAQERRVVTPHAVDGIAQPAVARDAPVRVRAGVRHVGLSP